jgi:hypothetical protein
VNQPNVIQQTIHFEVHWFEHMLLHLGCYLNDPLNMNINSELVSIYDSSFTVAIMNTVNSVILYCIGGRIRKIRILYILYIAQDAPWECKKPYPCRNKFTSLNCAHKDVLTYDTRLWTILGMWVTSRKRR